MLPNYISPRERFMEAYRAMAKFYRPAAPGDGLGGIDLSRRELDDPATLEREAAKYADLFLKEEHGGTFHVGCSNYETNRELVYVIEAARLLCSGLQGERLAARLLRMALRGLRGLRAGRGE